MENMEEYFKKYKIIVIVVIFIFLFFLGFILKLYIFGQEPSGETFSYFFLVKNTDRGYNFSNLKPLYIGYYEYNNPENIFTSNKIIYECSETLEDAKEIFNKSSDYQAGVPILRNVYNYGEGETFYEINVNYSDNRNNRSTVISYRIYKCGFVDDLHFDKEWIIRCEDDGNACYGETNPEFNPYIGTFLKPITKENVNYLMLKFFEYENEKNVLKTVLEENEKEIIYIAYISWFSNLGDGFGETIVLNKFEYRFDKRDGKIYHTKNKIKTIVTSLS